MENLLFYTYSKSHSKPRGLTIIQKLYLPIIGPNSLAFYHSLINTFKNGEAQNNIGNTINSLRKSLNINEKDFISARKILEAVGLIKTHLSNNETKIIFDILPPLMPENFFKNKLLKNLLLKRIGEVRLDTLMHFYKMPLIDLSDYVNISCNFQDLFDIDELTENNIDLTREMQLPTFKSLEEAIKGLSSNNFYKYLTGVYPNSYQIQEITMFLESGVSPSSLNLILNHSFIKNKAIVFNYIRSIILDFRKRNIISFVQMKNSLEASLKFKSIEKNHDIDIQPVSNKNTNDIFQEMIS